MNMTARPSAAGQSSISRAARARTASVPSSRGRPTRSRAKPGAAAAASAFSFSYSMPQRKWVGWTKTSSTPAAFSLARASAGLSTGRPRAASARRTIPLV